MNARWLKAVLPLAAAALAGACATTTVRTTEQTPVVKQTAQQIPESELLDVGINIFNPGVDDPAQGKDDPTVSPEIRKAESRYIPNVLATTLQGTGGWGVVRVVPDRRSEMDVWVDGEILKSDGESLKLQVTVSDSSGKTWFTKTYEGEASKYAYDSSSPPGGEPFQGVYNRIANDMLAFRTVMPPEEAQRVRTITEIRFAQRFAPEAFSDYLATDQQGHYSIMRLPAEDDPLLARVRRVRDRDNLFVDTLQDYYTSFANQMEQPYRQWRKETYDEAEMLKQAKQESSERMVGGALLAAAGIAAAVLGGSSGNPALQSLGNVAGVVGVGGGLLLGKSGYDKRSEVKMHIEALKELSNSLDSEIKPHTMTLEDRTVTLTGTVEQQYAEWRDILRQIYEKEAGAPAAAAPPAK